MESYSTDRERKMTDVTASAEPAPIAQSTIVAL
jgi:hypothetical protein